MGATAKGKKSVADASVVDSSEETASVSSTSSASLEDYGKTKGQKKSDASETTGRTGKTTTTTLCRSSNGLDTQSNNSADDDGGHFNDFSVSIFLVVEFSTSNVCYFHYYLIGSYKAFKIGYVKCRK